MLCPMLQAKIHRATVTDANLHYEGSISIDADLLEAAGIREFQQVHVVNINTGARFETYTIIAPRGDYCPPGERHHLPERRGRPACSARRSYHCFCVLHVYSGGTCAAYAACCPCGRKEPRFP